MTEFEPLVRPTSPELDAILGKKFPVLDDGFIRVVDYMGNDASIVQMARVSYGAGTKAVSEDRGLIRYLMRNRHTTPFEGCELKLHVRVPMDAWRQWIRTRTANVNETSTRYSIVTDNPQKTASHQWRSQAEDNKQGSGDYLDKDLGRILTKYETELHEKAMEVYNMRIQAGVAREQARKDLPLSTYTEAYWKIDLHNLMHFLSLRMDSHAQKEIRDFATVIGEDIVSKWCPIAWEAFKDYRVQGLNLTRLDQEVIASLTGVGPEAAIETAKELGLLAYKTDGTLKRNRERDELESKLLKLNLKAPW